MKHLFLFLFIFPLQLFAQLDVTQHNPPAGYTTSQLYHRKQIQCDQLGNIWMTFTFIGLGKYDGANWTMYNTGNSGIPSNTVNCIAIDSSGIIWLGTRLGLARFDGVNWVVYNTSNSNIAADSISTLHLFGGGLWLGTNSGASFFDGTSFQNYNTGNSGLLNDTVISFSTGTGTHTWIGTNGGVSKLDGNNWSDYTSANTALPPNNIYSLKEDLYGDLWIMLNDSGLHVLRTSGLVFSYCNDLYYEASICSTFKSILDVDANGALTIFGPDGALALIKNGYVYYYGVNTYKWGISSVYDASGDLWVINNYSSWKFSQVSFSGYQHSLDEITIYNAKDLNINEVEAMMLARGDMHWDLINPQYEVPKGSGKHSIYTSGLWIGGLDASGSLHLAAQTYRQSGNEYWPGPITGISVPFDSASCKQFNRIWSIYRYQVEAFKINYLNGSVANGTYTIPEDIMTWPANGNGIVIGDKAPFIDFNTDGIYNPFDGDFPSIKGDQMLFWIFNDSLAEHSNADGVALGIEVLASAYAFACPGIADSNQVLNWTTFYNYRILNASTHNYDSLYIGLWCDTDLGDATDDYLGCDTLNAAGFVYNGDNDDGGTTGYGTNPPIQNIQILKGMLADAGDGIDNDLDGVVDEPSEHTTMNHFLYYSGINFAPTGNPNFAIDFYNYMHSLWLDGTHVTYGGTGLIGSSGNTGQPTNFMFSGTPYDTGWTEASAGNLPEDRRFVIGSGPITLPAGDETSIDFAYVFTWDSLSPNGLTTSIARNIADLERVKRWFDTDSFPSCMVYSVGVEEMFTGQQPQIVVYPVPVFDWLTLKSDFPIENARLEIRDLFGRLIWTGKYSGKDIYTGNLSSGQYFIRIIAKAFTISQKFVKQ